MRRITFWIMVWGLVCTSAWAVNGDMGASTQPLTDGSADYPYLIEDVNDFDVFAGNSAYWAKDVHTQLMADINLSGKSYTKAVIAPFSGFSGVFAGNHFVVRNLRIDTSGVNTENLGLFSGLEYSAVISDLYLEDATIVGGTYSRNIGGIAGRNNGSLTNCYITGVIEGGGNIGGLVGTNESRRVINCYSVCSINCREDNVGGLVGYNNYGAVINCYSKGSVNSTGDYIGGLVGQNRSGFATNCYSTSSVNSTGDYVGGLVGKNSDSHISNCYSVGSVNGNLSVGGLVGENFYGSVTNCFWDKDTAGTTVGYNLSPSEPGTVTNVIGKTTAEMQIQSTFADAGWDFVGEMENGTSQVWQMPTAPDYPVLSIFNGFVPIVLSGDGSEETPYLIGNESELGAAYHYSPNSCYQMTSDIDLAGIQWSTAIILLFNGRYDGAGHTIFNLNVDGGSYLGLFGSLDPDGTVVNLGLENVSITGTGRYVSGLAGWNSAGSIINCFTTGTINGTGTSVGGVVGFNNSSSSVITDCYSHCTVSGAGNIGGLIGWNESDTVTNCYSTGLISGAGSVGGLVGYNRAGGVISYCYSTGNIDSTGIAGGLIGQNLGVVKNCNASGPVKGNNLLGGFAGINSGDGHLTSCYSTGSVNGNYYIGGFVGTNYGSLTGCYSTGSIDGNFYCGGLVGRNWFGNITGCSSIADVNSIGTFVGGLIGKDVSGNISDCHSNSLVSSSGEYHTGGLVGYLENSSISNCSSTGEVRGNFRVGGLVGNCDNGTLAKCFSSCKVSGDSTVGGLVGKNYYSSETNCYANGDVSGNSSIGGLVGYHDSSSVIRNCYSTGRVSGNTDIGGLVGYNWSGNVIYSFWDVDASGLTTTDGGTGKTTIEMQTQGTFTTWNFVNDWMMLREGEDTPRLAWQTVFAGDIAGLYGADLVDFVYVANYWGLTGCGSGTDCGRADIDGSGDVGLGDLAAVAEDWLKQ